MVALAYTLLLRAISHRVVNTFFANPHIDFGLTNRDDTTRCGIVVYNSSIRVSRKRSFLATCLVSRGINRLEMTKTRGKTFAVLSSFWHMAVTACPTYRVLKAVPAFGFLFQLCHRTELRLRRPQYWIGLATLARQRTAAPEALRIPPPSRPR